MEKFRDEQMMKIIRTKKEKKKIKINKKINEKEEEKVYEETSCTKK